MKTRLLKIALLLAAIFGLTANHKVFASHGKAADITYTQTGPFTYLVKLSIYRDCQGPGNPQGTTLNIDLKAPGCNTGRTAPLTLTGSTPLPLQECAGPQACTNFKDEYTGTVTLTTAEQSCRDWVFSWTDCCRPALANLVNSQGANLYTEAHVRTGQNFTNSSPEMSTLENPLAKVTLGMDAVYSLASNDPDCDSLSYELVVPLSAPNTPIPYAANPGFSSSPWVSSLVTNPCPKPPYGTSPFTSQFAHFGQTLPSILSPTYPMPSIQVNWDGRPTMFFPGAPFRDSIWQVDYVFKFDQLNATMVFSPGFFDQQAINDYAVEVMVNEWRKLNGVITKVGSTRRSLVFSIVNVPVGPIPRLRFLNVNGHPISSGQTIVVRPNSPVNIQFQAFNCNHNSAMTISSNVTSVLPGATFTTTNAPAAATISWSGATGCNAIKYFQIKIEVDYCQVKSFQLHTIGVRVSNTATVTGQSAEIRADAGFMAYPNPFSNLVKFSYKVSTAGRQEILIYNSLGQLIDRLNLTAAGEEQEMIWEKATSQRSGIYIARLLQNGQPVQTIRFTKTN